MDGRATGSHLRRPRGCAAAPVDGDDDQRRVSGAVPRMDGGDAADCLDQARHRCEDGGVGPADVGLRTLNYVQKATDADGNKLYHGQRQGVTFPMADALCWLLASRCQILDVLELEERGAAAPGTAEGLPGTVQFLSDLCHVQAAQAAGEVGRICAELVFGYNRHPAWDDAGCKSCFSTHELDELEET